MTEKTPDQEKYPNRHVMGGYPKALQEVKVTVPVEDFKGPAYGVDEQEEAWKQAFAEEVNARFPTDEEVTVNWADVPERSVLLREAEQVITQDRNNQYGPPTQDFSRTAEMATAAGFRVVDSQGVVVELSPHHVAIFMMLLKTSRLMWDPENRDSWLDAAGYSACGYECVVENDCA